MNLGNIFQLSMLQHLIFNLIHIFKRNEREVNLPLYIYLTENYKNVVLFHEPVLFQTIQFPLVKQNSTILQQNKFLKQ